jgi:hypothetical protein
MLRKKKKKEQKRNGDRADLANYNVYTLERNMRSLRSGFWMGFVTVFCQGQLSLQGYQRMIPYLEGIGLAA